MKKRINHSVSKLFQVPWLRRKNLESAEKYLLSLIWFLVFPGLFFVTLIGRSLQLDAYPWTVVSLLLCLSTYVFLYFSGIQRKTEFLVFLILFLFISIAIFSFIYLDLGIVNTTDASLPISLDDCRYFSTVTWTTLGYGDFRPKEASRFYAAAEALLGYVYMGVLISTVFDYLSRLTPRELKAQQQLPLEK